MWDVVLDEDTTEAADVCCRITMVRIFHRTFCLDPYLCSLSSFFPSLDVPFSPRFSALRVLFAYFCQSRASSMPLGRDPPSRRVATRSLLVSCLICRSILFPRPCRVSMGSPRHSWVSTVPILLHRLRAPVLTTTW